MPYLERRGSIRYLLAIPWASLVLLYTACLGALNQFFAGVLEAEGFWQGFFNGLKWACIPLTIGSLIPTGICYLIWAMTPAKKSPLQFKEIWCANAFWAILLCGGVAPGFMWAATTAEVPSRAVLVTWCEFFSLLVLSAVAYWGIATGELKEFRERDAEAAARRAKDEREQNDRRELELVKKRNELGLLEIAQTRKRVDTLRTCVGYRNELIALRLLDDDYLEETVFPINALIEHVDRWESLLRTADLADVDRLVQEVLRQFGALHWEIQKAAARGRLLGIYDRIADVVGSKLPRNTFVKLINDIGSIGTSVADDRKEFQKMETFLNQLCEKNRDRWQKVAEANLANSYFDLFEATKVYERKSNNEQSSSARESRGGVGENLRGAIRE